MMTNFVSTAQGRRGPRAPVTRIRRRTDNANGRVEVYVGSEFVSELGLKDGDKVALVHDSERPGDCLLVARASDLGLKGNPLRFPNSYSARFSYILKPELLTHLLPDGKAVYVPTDVAACVCSGGFGAISLSNLSTENHSGDDPSVDCAEEGDLGGQPDVVEEDEAVSSGS